MCVRMSVAFSARYIRNYINRFDLCFLYNKSYIFYTNTYNTRVLKLLKNYAFYVFILVDLKLT